MGDFVLRLFEAFILGIVEGVTEFLPISSTGHLILFTDLFHLTETTERTFEIVIQGGAILGVCVFYSGRLYGVVRGFFLTMVLGHLCIGYCVVFYRRR